MHTQAIQDHKTIAHQTAAHKTAAHKTTELIDAAKVFIAFERPSRTTLEQLNRGAKFRTLIKRSREQRAKLLEWAADHQLLDEIVRVGEPTAFNMIFVEASAHAIEQLLDAPQVEKIVRVPDSDLDLIQHNKGSTL